jgi:hypothetical protein
MACDLIMTCITATSTLAGTLAGVWLTQRHQERQERWRAAAQAQEKLKDLRITECARMLTSSDKRSKPLPPGEMANAAAADLADAASILELFGPAALAGAAHSLMMAAQPPCQTHDFDAARDEFLAVAKRVIGVNDDESWTRPRPRRLPLNS